MKKLLFFVIFIFSIVDAPAQTSSTENFISASTCLDADCVKKAWSVQYFDGLGRPKQVVNVKASPTGQDLVTTTPYDGFGRQVDSWLPVPMATLSGGIQPGVEEAAIGFYTDSAPFSHKKLENSPLDRIRQQVQPGEAWSAKPVSFDYRANVDSEVHKYVTATVWNDNATSSVLTLAQATDVSSHNHCYRANQLYKNVVTDEDGNTTVEFRNGQGQTVLIRKNDGTQNADTYYVYNEYDQLAFVIPPKAVGSLFPDTTKPSDTLVLSDLAYQYRYDGRNRLVEKKLPGKGWEYMAYDNQDRLVMTQDANMGADRQWLFTKYDQFGRVAYTGIYTGIQDYGSAGRQYEQGEINKKGSNNVARTKGGTGYGSGVILYYDNLSANNYPNTITELLSINYYDSYPAGSPAVPATILAQNVLQQNAQASNLSTKSLPTATLVKNLDKSVWTKTYIWYDTKGRTIGTNSVNHLGGYTNTRSLLDFSGVVKEAFTYHKRTSGSTETVIKETFEYDHQNRLTVHRHQVGPQPEEILARNTYNEIGQLETKRVGGPALASPIQSIEYSYNIRGWLTGINVDKATGNFDSSKLFNYRIGYNDSLGALPATPYAADRLLEIKEKYNGNIATVTWKYNDVPGVPEKKYGYVYDMMNRLLAGFYYQNTGNGFLFTEEHNEIQKYDLNGNISELKRFSYKAGTAAHKIDDLTYSYTGNKVSSITDAGNSNGYEGGGATISYDGNGNMTDMLDKGISSIAYNHLNLPMQTDISPDGNSTSVIKNAYRADGVKIRKENTTTTAGIRDYVTTVHTTEYLDGFQYLESKKSSDDAGSSGLLGELETQVAMEREAFSPESRAEAAPPGPVADNTVLQFVPTAEGFYDFTENKYIYQYKDHLGNTRLSYAWNTTTNSIDVLDKNDYYPFGMNHLDVNAGSFFGQGLYKNYKYNGKELQETGLYDYGARMYLADIGRFGTIDPLAEKYPDISPFTYVANNPIKYTDPTGMWIYIIDGGYTYRYHNGNYYMQNGETKRWDVETSVKSDSYAGQILSALTSITGGDENSFGSQYLNLFANDDINTTIKDSSLNGSNAGRNGATLDGSTVFTAFKQDVTLDTTSGSKQSPFHVTLFHELGHSFSNQVFDNNILRSEWTTIPQESGDTKIPKSEVYSSTIENVLRAEQNLPLRLNYSPGTTNTQLIQKVSTVPLINNVIYKLNPVTQNIFNSIIQSKK